MTLVALLAFVVLAGGVYFVEKQKNQTNTVSTSNDISTQNNDQNTNQTNNTSSNNSTTTSTDTSNSILNIFGTATLKLSMTKTNIEFGETNPAVLITPELGNTKINWPVNITLTLIKPDGTKGQEIKTTWPGREMCPGAVGTLCSLLDPNKPGPISFSFNDSTPNFEFLKSGTYKVTGTSEGNVLKIIGTQFTLDSSVAEKIVGPTSVGDYKVIRFQSYKTGSGAQGWKQFYRIGYGMNGTENEQFNVEIEKTGSNQEAITKYQFYLHLPPPDDQVSDISIDGTILKAYSVYSMKYPVWASGNYVVLINTYVATSASNQVIKSYLTKYPQTN